MKMRVRIGFVVIIALGLLGLAGCDHYVCTSGAQFGNTTCTAGAAGLGGSTGTGSATAAFAFVIDTAGTIDGYTLDTTSDTFQATTGYTGPTAPANNGGVGMVVAQSQFLYAAFADVGGIYGWTISSSGSLTPINGSPFPASFLEDTALPVSQAMMITNPGGTLLFVSANSQSEIFIYQIGSGGVLTPASPASVPVPFDPQNLATDGLGKYLYAIDGNLSNHTGSEIAAYEIGTGGTLTTVTGSPFVYPMWQLQGEPTGQFMIGTTGNSMDTSGAVDDHLYVFSIAQSGTNAGAITPVSGSPFATTYSPFSIAVQSNTGGNLVYSFSFNNSVPPTGFNGIEGYEISSSGALTAVSGSPFSNVGLGTWGQFDQSGAFLFVWSSVFNDNTDAQVTQLGPDDVGSGGALTEPIPLVTLSSESFWAVTDAP